MSRRYGYEFTVDAVAHDVACRLPLVPYAEIEKAARRHVPTDAWVNERGVARYVDGVLMELDGRLIAGVETSFAREVPFLLQKDAAPAKGRHQVLGVVYCPGEVDTDGNYMTAETIAAAADRFLPAGGKPGIQHTEFNLGDEVRITRSYVTTTSEVIGGQNVPAGSWLMGFDVSQAIFDRIVAGELTGLSLGGVATVREGT